jgi:hypothetical protein
MTRLARRLQEALLVGDDALDALGGVEPDDDRDALLTLLTVHDLHLAPVDALGRRARWQQRPPMATCFRCHAHERVREQRVCSACHVDLADEGTLPASHLVHDGDWLREHGARAASAGDLCASCHRERFCADCHGAAVPALPARARLDDPWQASVHRAGFRARHGLEARAAAGTCSTCHSPDTCASCHDDTGVAASVSEVRASPHPPGWVGLTAAANEHGRAARRDPASCASCHGGAGEMLCVGCHRVGGVGGSPHAPGWTSRQALTDLPCRLCHVGGR